MKLKKMWAKQPGRKQLIIISKGRITCVLKVMSFRNPLDFTHTFRFTVSCFDGHFILHMCLTMDNPVCLVSFSVLIQNQRIYLKLLQTSLRQCLSPKGLSERRWSSTSEGCIKWIWVPADTGRNLFSSWHMIGKQSRTSQVTLHGYICVK